MKKFILIVFFCLITQSCFGAEFLVKAKSHWLDVYTSVEINQMVADGKITLAGYNSRSQIGDIIVIRPDGWQWGKEECLPNYIVVKVPDMYYEEAKKYEEPLMKEITNERGEKETRMIKRRKWHIPIVEVKEAKAKNGILIRTKAQKLNNIKEKTE